MTVNTRKEYEYFIAVLTKRGKLVSGYATAASFSEAYDHFLDVNELAGCIESYTFTVVRNKGLNS